MNPPSSFVLSEPPGGVSIRNMPPELARRSQELEQNARRLVARTRLGEFWPLGFIEVSRSLQEAPLATVAFAAAKRHLRNALDYCRLNEFGAATFELEVFAGVCKTPVGRQDGDENECRRARSRD